MPGAVLTRVAASHIRVGTFQYFYARNDRDALEALVSHAIERHAHEADGPLGLLNHVVEHQAKLVAAWLGIGFIHGVMNTDNMTVSGETIDYGPCAFMDDFSPMRVFSSIDHQGRYAYSRQPDIAMWNLAQLATALLPLIGKAKDAQAALDRFPALFRDAWLTVFRAKLGLQTEEDGDYELILALLDAMANGKADFTNTFRSIGAPNARDAFSDPELYGAWENSWRKRLDAECAVPYDRVNSMHAANPALIPRNHRIEQAIQAAVAGDLCPFENLNAALQATVFRSGRVRGSCKATGRKRSRLSDLLRHLRRTIDQHEAHADKHEGQQGSATPAPRPAATIPRARRRQAPRN